MCIIKDELNFRLRDNGGRRKGKVTLFTKR